MVYWCVFHRGEEAGAQGHRGGGRGLGAQGQEEEEGQAPGGPREAGGARGRGQGRPGEGAGSPGDQAETVQRHVAGARGKPTDFTIPGVPEKAERWLFNTLRAESVVYLYIIR